MPDIGELLGPLQTLFNELTRGVPGDAGFILNPKDAGLHASLDRLTAQQASAQPSGGGASIAAHVDHLRYGLELLNRWQRGEEPFESADWGASWQRTKVTDEEWATRRAELRQEVETARQAMMSPRDTTPIAITGIVASMAHLAYHLGAIRQIDRTSAGPLA